MKALLLSALLLLATLVPAAAAEKYRSFAGEGEAATACGQDVVVWINKNTKVYHLKGARWYGKTKDGAYACRAEADRAGFHVAKAAN